MSGAGFRWLNPAGHHYGVPASGRRAIAERPPRSIAAAPGRRAAHGRRSLQALVGGQHRRPRVASHRARCRSALLSPRRRPASRSRTPGSCSFGPDGLALVPPERSRGPRYVRLDVRARVAADQGADDARRTPTCSGCSSARRSKRCSPNTRARAARIPSSSGTPRSVMQQPGDSLPHDDHLHLRTACTARRGHRRLRRGRARLVVAPRAAHASPPRNRRQLCSWRCSRPSRSNRRASRRRRSSSSPFRRRRARARAARGSARRRRHRRTIDARTRSTRRTGSFTATRSTSAGSSPAGRSFRSRLPRSPRSTRGAPSPRAPSADEARGRRTKRAAPAPTTTLGGRDGFLAMLRPRLAAIRERMSPEATLYLHLDHRTVHYAKVLCDELFGAGAFRGEIIWVPGNGARGATGPERDAPDAARLQPRTAPQRGRFIWNADDPMLREPLRRHQPRDALSRPRPPTGAPTASAPSAAKPTATTPTEGAAWAACGPTPRHGRQHAAPQGGDRLPHAEARESSWSASSAPRAAPGRRGRRFDVRQRHDAGRRRAARPHFRRRRQSPLAIAITSRGWLAGARSKSPVTAQRELAAPTHGTWGSPRARAKPVRRPTPSRPAARALGIWPALACYASARPASCAASPHHARAA